jgi:hypothetical protein
MDRIAIVNCWSADRLTLWVRTEIEIEDMNRHGGQKLPFFQEFHSGLRRDPR